MRAIRTKIGTADILVETIDDPLEVIGQTGSERLTETTGVVDQLKDAYGKAKTTIKEIAQDVGQDLVHLGGDNRPEKVELEFGLGLSAGAGVWIITAKGESVLKVKMTWGLANERE